MQFIKPATLALALAAMLSTTALVAPSNAAEPVHVKPAAAHKMATPVVVAKQKTTDRYSTAEHVEARVADLHAKLRITSAQETQWARVAVVMRDNANTIEETSKTRQQNYSDMTAIDDLRSYEALAAAHAGGLKNLVTEFSALYDTMSVDQKKTADGEFRSYERRVTASSSAVKGGGGKRTTVVKSTIR